MVIASDVRWWLMDSILSLAMTHTLALVQRCKFKILMYWMNKKRSSFLFGCFICAIQLSIHLSTHPSLKWCVLPFVQILSVGRWKWRPIKEHHLCIHLHFNIILNMHNMHMHEAESMHTGIRWHTPTIFEGRTRKTWNLKACCERNVHQSCAHVHIVCVCVCNIGVIYVSVLQCFVHWIFAGDAIKWIQFEIGSSLVSKVDSNHGNSTFSNGISLHKCESNFNQKVK